MSWASGLPASAAICIQPRASAGLGSIFSPYGNKSFEITAGRLVVVLARRPYPGFRTKVRLTSFEMQQAKTKLRLAMAALCRTLEPDRGVSEAAHHARAAGVAFGQPELRLDMS